MAYFHLGIDYGTSASKVIVRSYDDPEGERAYPLQHSDGSFRIPSAIAYHQGTLYLGRNATNPAVPQGASWYTSIKMRVAAKYGSKSRAAYYGDVPAGANPPAGLSFEHLFVIGLAWVMELARRKASELCKKQKLGVPEMGFTVGIPTDLFYDAPVRDVFVALCRAAWSLDIARYLDPTGTMVAAVPPLLADVRRLVDARLRDPSSPVERARSWLCPEALAAIWWAWSSPSTGLGSYLKVDIGAGTTNVAAFTICGTYVQRTGRPGGWQRNRIAVFGADSGTVGMDAIEQRFYQLYPNLNVSRMPSITRPQWGAVLVGLELPYRRVFGEIRQKTGGQGQPWNQWNQAHIFHLGGGSRVQAVCDALSFHPNNLGLSLPVWGLSAAPSDIAIHPSMVSQARCNLMVAYGLSVLDGNLPTVTSSRDIDPIPPSRRERPEHKDIYSK